MKQAPMVLAVEAPELSARVLSSRPLLYSEGANLAEDRPPHVRAGSSMVHIGGRLVIVQDDALFLALVDTQSGRVDSIPLPAVGGVRCFDDERGNKAGKPDFEACLEYRDALYIFGSGSTASRERVVRVGGICGSSHGAAPVLEVLKAHRLYASLRSDVLFSGSELNVEGALVVEGRLRLFQRGNGAPHGGISPVNAICDLDLDHLFRYLDSGDAMDPPPVREVTQFNLGAMGGVKLSFTDAAALGDDVLYLAAAEDSPDALRDGPVAGVALGIIHAPSCHARWTQLLGRDGSPFRGKAEGLALDPLDPGLVHVIVDPDDIDIPAAWCRVEIRGFNRSR